MQSSRLLELPFDRMPMGIAALDREIDRGHDRLKLVVGVSTARFHVSSSVAVSVALQNYLVK